MTEEQDDGLETACLNICGTQLLFHDLLEDAK